ncbi:Lrp/AsnC family transcriptional regulator [bacterium]|nr:Lrp/AsnC family transcriptional regulator [bacterium]
MIDKIDSQIIALLQTDARLSNAALAEKVGLTTSTVHERVKKLEKKGIIRGYVAVVNAEALGKPIIAFIRLSVGSVSADYLESKNSVLSICQDEPDVLECHTVAGEDCYILKVRATSPAHLENLIERIRCNARVSRTTTNIVLSTLKETTRVMPDIGD